MELEYEILSCRNDNRLDWLRIGDDLGAPMQRMITDVNNLRWNHPALRSPAGEITHTDFTNNVVAFKRWNKCRRRSPDCGQRKRRAVGTTLITS
jgi:hypothetical protein